MYLHLGGSIVVPAAEIVTILDARLISAEANRGLLREVIAAGRLQADDLKACKAFVVTVKGIYPSAISPQSLAKRLGGPP